MSLLEVEKRESVGREESGVKRVRLLGMPLDVVTEAEAVEILTERLNRREGTWVVTPNLDILRQYHGNSRVRMMFEGVDLFLADGMPLVWASRIGKLNGNGLPERVAGSTLTLALAGAADRHGWHLFLLGGSSGAAERAAAVLRGRFRSLQIAGTYCPPMGFEKSREEMEKLVGKLREAKPDLIYVALGFPKQELLIERLREVLPNATFIGVGISLSFIAGTVARAPGWVQRLGLEWVHRLVHEPKRLAKRYLLQGLPFAVCILFPHAIAARYRRQAR